MRDDRRQTVYRVQDAGGRLRSRARLAWGGLPSKRTLPPAQSLLMQLQTVGRTPIKRQFRRNTSSTVLALSILLRIVPCGRLSEVVAPAGRLRNSLCGSLSVFLFHPIKYLFRGKREISGRIHLVWRTAKHFPAFSLVQDCS